MDDTFDGFSEPLENWSKLPNELIEAMPLISTIAELKVILYILRHTWGFKDEWKRITTEEFVTGRRRKDGTRIDNGTGLTEPSIRGGLKAAEEHGFIQVEINDTDKGRVQKFYSLKMYQGEKLLPPDLKTFTPRGKKIYPRTEKETIERNLNKDIYNGANAPAGPKTQLMDCFLAETKMILPHKKTDRNFWWSTLTELYEIASHDTATGCGLIRRAVAYMHKQNLTIGGPESIIKTCRALAAGQDIEKGQRTNGQHHQNNSNGMSTGQAGSGASGQPLSEASQRIVDALKAKSRRDS